VEGNVDTGLIERGGAELTAQPMPGEVLLQSAALCLKQMAEAQLRTRMAAVTQPRAPWDTLLGFRLNAEQNPTVRVRWRDRVFLTAPKGPEHFFIRNGEEIVVFENGETYEFTLDTGERAEGEEAGGDGAILSPMPGKIVSVAAKAGARVKKGDALVVLEAMKMEHTLTAPFDGRVTQLNAKPGAQVSEGVLLAKLEKGE
jgi:3-methylcrotonyl-CoA carboxylase alpha subunit